MLGLPLNLNDRNLAQTTALAKSSLVTQHEFMAKISEERAMYQRMLNLTPQ
jgi:hypothetical protein